MKHLTTKLYRTFKSSQGFTLIEMLVVFSLITILSGLGIVSFANYSHAQEVNQAASKLRLMVGEARFNAVSSVKKITSSSGTSIYCLDTDQQLGFYIDVGVSGISLYMNCRDAGGKLIKTYKLPQNITYNSKTCTQIYYDALSATAQGVPCNMVIKGYNITKTISVDSGGIGSIQ